MRLSIAGDEYEGKKSVNDEDKTVFTFPSIEIDHTSKIKLYVDTTEKAEKNASTTFTLDIEDAFKYVDAKDKDTKVDIAGTLNISKLTISDSEGDLTNTLTSEEIEFKLNESSEEVEIFNGKYTADQRTINLNEFSLTVPTDKWPNDAKMTVYLYLGGSNSAVADAKLDFSKDPYIATDTFSNVKVEAKGSIDVKVTAVVEAKDTKVEGTQFTLYLRGEDENGNPVNKADKKTAKLSIVDLGTAEIEVGSSSKTVLLRGSDDAVAQFTVKPSGGSKMDVESVSFDLPAEGFDCGKLRLE
jgi:hypothetical protein